MDTRWGLDLDMAAVRLMRLDDGAWVENAVEKIDSTDIEERLKAMLSVIEPGAPVVLFLPREQILYTDVELAGDAEAGPQIERALDGRTPYSLDELSFDWEIAAPGTARVAAIALDTLDEAAAFAEVRGLAVAGYSSLAGEQDFPRLPRFDGPIPAVPAEPEEPTGAEEPDTPTEPAPAFTSARKPSRPPGSEVTAASAAAAQARTRLTPVAPDAASDSAAAASSEEPVIRVEDATPVMRVREPSVPLDPGIPISAPNAPPRIRTDIAAASVAGPASSLTPPASIKMRTRAAPIGTAAIFAVAFLLTVGIAILVWSLLPMRPQTPIAVPPAAESSARPDVAEAPQERAATEPPEAEPQPVPAPPSRPEELALAADPAPALSHTAPSLGAADAADAAPQLAAPAAAPARPPRPAALAVALKDGSPRPVYDPEPPVPVTPAALAAIPTAAPLPGPEPDLVEGVGEVHFASFEPAQLAFDAIALPDHRTLAADPLPRVDPVTGAEAPDPSAAPDAIARALNDALAGPGGLIPTELASSLPETPPRVRPGDFDLELQRRRFGGLTRTELAERRPNARPASAQDNAAPAPVSDLAIVAPTEPRQRPDGFTEVVAQARARQQAAEVTASASYQAPDTSSAIIAALDDGEPEARPETLRQPSIPSSASVARQATFEDAIRLNRINLVGVYGVPSDRRALVRLPSGRYVKVKVGDRVDGGTVARITDNQLHYRKGNRLLALEIPQG